MVRSLKTATEQLLELLTDRLRKETPMKLTVRFGAVSIYLLGLEP